MNEKQKIERYGIHLGICFVIFLIAFSINRKVIINRNHRYTLSEPVFTLLKEVSMTVDEKGKLIFEGFSFDTQYYGEKIKNEMILQDTKSQEAVWVKMEKVQTPVKIPERYATGEDYSKAGFRGSIKTDKLRSDRVYGVLIRYTSDYTDTAGNKQQYVKTVTTDEYIYQGEMTAYNPETFTEPQIAGTELEKELEGARLFHYFPEGMWVYYDEANIYYIVEKEGLEWNRNPKCPVHWRVQNEKELPEDRWEYKFGNSDFYLKNRLVPELENLKYIVARIEIPSKYITYFTSGIYYDDAGWSYQVSKQWK